MVDFNSLFYQMESMGFYEYVLPFFLFFVVIYAVLEKTRILGGTEDKPKSKLNIVLSVVISLLVLFNTNLVFLMNQTLSRVSFFIIISVLVMLFVALFYNPKDGKPIGFSMGIASVLAILGVFWSLSGSYYGHELLPYWLYLDDSTISLIFFVALFGVIVYFITGPHESSSPKEKWLKVRD